MTTIVRIDANELASMHNATPHHHHQGSHLLATNNQATIVTATSVGQSGLSGASTLGLSGQTTVDSNSLFMPAATGNGTTLAPVQVLLRNSYVDSDRNSLVSIGSNQVLLTTSGLVKIKPVQQQQQSNQQSQSHSGQLVSGQLIATTSQPTTIQNIQQQTLLVGASTATVSASSSTSAPVSVTPATVGSIQLQHHHVPSVNSELSNGSVRCHNDKQNLYGQHLR